VTQELLLPIFNTAHALAHIRRLQNPHTASSKETPVQCRCFPLRQDSENRTSNRERLRPVTTRHLLIHIESPRSQPGNEICSRALPFDSVPPLLEKIPNPPNYENEDRCWYCDSPVDPEF
jgi:hypothetical protein